MSRSLDRALARMRVGDSPAANIVAPLADQARQLAGLQRRQQADITNVTSTRLVTVPLTSASTVNLGAVDGNNLTGVRLFGHITVVGIAAAAFLRLRPNGLSSIPQNAVGEEVALGVGPSYTTTNPTGLYSGGIFGTGTGLAVADLRAFSAASLDITFNGFFSTHTGVRRMYQGMTTAVDLTTDANRMAQDVLSGRWNDTTTPITSLTIVPDSGTITGRITMEFVP